jgi:phosphomannomutase
MKPFDYYSKPQTLYPNKQNYISYYVYDKGKVLWSGHDYEKTKSELEKEYPDAVIQVVMDNEGYNEHKKQYGEETHKLYEEFVNDLFEEFGVTDNPKRHKAFQVAWQQGHAYGFEEVYNKFDDLVELIRD